MARSLARLRAARRTLLFTLAALPLVAVCAAASASAAAAAGATPRERVEIVLDVDALPEADRERFADRKQAIADAIASGLPLWRSFEPRDVLRDSLAALAAHGVDVGESAIVNFDSLEADVAAGKRDELDALPFVRRVFDPAFATPSGSLDSEGLEVIGSDVANLAGVTGAGVTVAIIDSEWRSLAATMASDLPAIPVTMQFRVNGIGTTISNAAADGGGLREHGTAAAEVVHEVAPAATLLLYRLDYNGQLLVTPAAIKLAIRHAADQGAKVILVPLHFIRTMSDPEGLNPFTDDIAYAKAVGATVVVPAGNEALRHYAAQFTPCAKCSNDDLCNTAANDNDYHLFDDDLPINDIFLDGDWEEYVYASETGYNQVRFTCYSATDAADPSKFKIQLLRFRENFDAVDPPDYPYCPRDAGVTVVSGTEQTLGSSFSKNLPIENDSFYDYYYLAVKRTGGTEQPNFRINCTVAAGELTYFRSEQSLSDLAVVDDTIAVGAGSYPYFDTILETSSWGPTSDPSGPIKPDLIAPGEVSSFAVLNEAFAFFESFVGSSAASAHVAGVVALLQSYQGALGLTPFTPAQVKTILTSSAIDLDDGLPEYVGPDPVYGHGLVQVPAALLPGEAPEKVHDDWDGDGVADRATFFQPSGTWSWIGSTSGAGSLGSFGASRRAVPADYDGDGITDVGCAGDRRHAAVGVTPRERRRRLIARVARSACRARGDTVDQPEALPIDRSRFEQEEHLDLLVTPAVTQHERQPVVGDQRLELPA
ncbi:MAG: S8 family serine peptidase [Thermodesulfobacteriota bacterium]